jgi:hypothetical protein
MLMPFAAAGLQGRAGHAEAIDEVQNMLLPV